MKSRIIFIALLVLIIITALILFQTKDKTDQIVIGAVLPLSGEVASYGNDSKEGIDLALEIANKNQDKFHFVVKYQDSQGDPKTAVTSLQQLLTDGDIKAFIGENISSSTLAMVPIIDRKGIILISPSASTPKLTGASKYFFRVFPSDVAEGSFVANKIDEQHPNGKVCIMYFNNDYGLGLTNVFKDEATNIGLNVSAVFAYAQDATNFKRFFRK